MKNRLIIFDTALELRRYLKEMTMWITKTRKSRGLYSWKVASWLKQLGSLDKCCKIYQKRSRNESQHNIISKILAGDLLQENAINLVHPENIYFRFRIYLPAGECCSAEKWKWNRKILWRKFFAISYLGLYWYIIIYVHCRHKKQFMNEKWWVT